MTLHIPFKSHIPRESQQQQQFTEDQNISRNFKQIKLHQQTSSFQECKQIFDATEGMQHWHMSPRALYQIKLKSKYMTTSMSLYKATVYPDKFITALDKVFPTKTS